MSRALASDFTAEKDKLFSRPFPSAIFHFGGSLGDVAISGHDVTIGGISHRGLVKEWGEYGALSQLRDGMFSTAGMRMRIINHRLVYGTVFIVLRRFTDYLSWPGIGIEGVEVDVYQNFLKSDAPGTILQALVFAGVLRPGEYSPDICELEIAPISEKYLSQEISSPIDQTDFPNANTDDIGKRANQIVGQVKKARAHCVSQGLKSTLRATIGTGDTTVPIHDNFYDAMPTSGTVQIGNEKIAYTGKGGTAGARTLTGLTRGSGSTPVESHNKDDTIIQIVTSWIYLAAGHAMKALGTVYVKRGDKLIPLAAAQYTANLSNTTLVSGKTLTTITFTAPPLISEKDYVALSSSESQWTDYGSDESLSFTKTGAWDTNNGENKTVSGPSQSKTKSSGNFVKHFSVERASGSEPSNINLYADIDNSGGPSGSAILLFAGDTKVGAMPVQFSNSSFWSMFLKRWRVGTPTNPATTTVVYNVQSKTSTYAIAGASLSSTSTADNPIGDIYFDGDGYADDGSGTYTGTANALIEKPADVMHHLARVVGAIPAARVDAASFQQARSDAPASHKFAGVLTDRSSNLKTLLLALSAQSRIKIDWPADKLTARFLKTSYGAATKTITRDQVRAQDGGDGRKATLRLSRTPVEDLINKIDLYYGRDWSQGRSKDSYTKISKTSDSTSITKYGTREDEDRFLFDFIAADNSTMADDLRDFWIARLKEPARVAEFEAFLDQIELLPGDVVALDYLVGASEKFDGLAGANKFLLEELRISPRSPAAGQAPIVRLKFREVA